MCDDPELFVSWAFRTSDHIELSFPGAVSKVHGSHVLHVNAVAALRIDQHDRDKRKLLLAHFAGLKPQETFDAFAGLRKRAGRRQPTAFRVLVDRGDLRIGDLLASLKKKGTSKGRLEGEIRLRAGVKLAGRSKEIVSGPIRGVIRVDDDFEREVEPSVLNSLFKLRWCPRWCHSHWHGDWDVPDSWWTQCHGTCTGSQCRCNRTPGNPRGFAICNGWTSCWC